MKITFITFTILAGVSGQLGYHQLAISLWVLSAAFALALFGAFLDGSPEQPEEEESEEEQP